MALLQCSSNVAALLKEGFSFNGYRLLNCEFLLRFRREEGGMEIKAVGLHGIGMVRAE